MTRCRTSLLGALAAGTLLLVGYATPLLGADDVCPTSDGMATNFADSGSVSLSERGAAILHQIQDLAGRISPQLGALRAAARSGEAPSGGAPSAAESWTEHLDRLASSCEELGDDEASYIAAKIDSVRALADDLMRQSRAGAAAKRGAPQEEPLPAPTPTRSAGMQAPANDSCAAAQPIGLGWVAGETTTATNDGGAWCGASNESPDVWYAFTAPSTGRFVVGTEGSDFDTVISVHTGCPSDPTAIQLACNDDALGLQSRLLFVATEGVTYLIRVSGAVDAVGSFTLQLGRTGHVRGKVTDAATGLPLGGILVRLYSATDLHDLMATTHTNADGSYTLTSPRLRPVVVGVTEPTDGYEDELYQGIPCPGGPDVGCSVTDGLFLDLTEPDSEATADFALQLAAGMAGEAHEAGTGLPLEGTYTVTAYDQMGRRAGSTTSSSAAWRLRELPPGTYFALLSSFNYGGELFDGIPWTCCDPTVGTPILVRDGVVTEGVTFSPTRHGSVSGRVLDAFTGEPVANARIQVLDTDGNTVSSTWARSDGTYAVGGLEHGRYYIRAGGSCHADAVYPDVPCGGGASGCPFEDAGLVEIDADSVDLSGIDVRLPAVKKISGNIFDQRTGEPVGGAVVEAWGYTAGSRSAAVATDTTGHYELACLAPNSYHVVIQDGGEYVEELYDDVPCPGGLPDGCDRRLATPVPVSLEQSATGVDFALTPGAPIQGHVTDAHTGAPLSGAWMSAWKDQGLAATARSGPDGGYALGGLAPGRYYVLAGASEHLGALYDGLPCPTAPPDGCTPALGTPVDIPAGPPTPVTGIDFTLEPKGAITGRITARDMGAGLAAVEVIVWDELGLEVGSDDTDTTGLYRLGDLAAGSYFITASELGSGRHYLSELYQGHPCDMDPPAGCPVTGGTPVRVEQGQVRSGIDLNLRRGAEVSGTVVDAEDGTGLSGSLQVWRDGVLLRELSFRDGTFKLEGLPAGTYSFVVNRSDGHIGQVYDRVDCEGYPEDCSPDAGTPVTLHAGDVVTGIGFLLKRAKRTSIQGIVTLEGTGEPLGEVGVRVFDQQDTYVGGDSSSADGFYSTTPLPPGSYLVETSSNRFIDELFRDVTCVGACPHELGEPVEVNPNRDTRHVDFSLRRRGAVSGLVTDALSGEPVPGRQVSALTPAGFSVSSTSADGDGVYRFTDLDPGTYYFAAEGSQNSTWLTEVYNGVTCISGEIAECLADATPVTVAPESDTTGIDLSLRRRGRISGTITMNGSGTAIRAYVSLYDAATLELVERSRTSAFDFTLLPWGTYLVYVSDSDIVPELYDGIPCPGGLDTGCGLESATPIALTASEPESVLDLAVDRLGHIGVEIRNSGTGETMSAHITLFDRDGGVVRELGSAGTYTITGVPPGAYLAAASHSNFAAQLYDGIGCPEEDAESCDLDLATPIRVEMNSDSDGIEFDLAPLYGSEPVEVTALVTSAATGLPLASAHVQFYSPGGYDVRGCATDETGTCRTTLDPGVYLAAAEASLYETQLYDGIACTDECDVVKGTHLVVGEGRANAVSFALRRKGPAVSGRVTRIDGSPVPFAVIDAWDAEDGAWVDAATADGNGSFLLPLPQGTYHLSTDNGQGLVDEVYDDVQCPSGPVYDGLCDPSRGAVVPMGDVPVSGIDFVLGEPGNSTNRSEGGLIGLTSDGRRPTPSSPTAGTAAGTGAADRDR